MPINTRKYLKALSEQSYASDAVRLGANSLGSATVGVENPSSTGKPLASVKEALSMSRILAMRVDKLAATLAGFSPKVTLEDTLPPPAPGVLFCVAEQAAYTKDILVTTLETLDELEELL